METGASSLGYLWLVPGAPLVACALIALVTRPWRRLSATVSIAAISVSFMFSLGALASQLRYGTEARLSAPLQWFNTGTLSPVISLLLDPLSVVMLVVVTTVGLLVQVYSLGYMGRETGLSRYYAYMSLFCASMLGLVLASNFLQLYIFWELVGLCSYLLIGFWYDRDAPAFAAKKAFVTTRLGDLGLLIGLIMICTRAGSFDFAEIQNKMVLEAWDTAWVTTAALLVFCGAVGKSAQIPLHVWLPDAMEGPTPVSALIHAATMVVAGVYLVARTMFLFSASPEAMQTVAMIGGLTAFFAATIALVQNDIKRVLAYSTISQLGYMMLALGVGGLSAGMFHLYTHAFFKALLFLCAGAVIHSLSTNDIWKMGGLRKVMPWTAWTFAIGALSLSGIPPLAGFFSKDGILAAVSGKSGLLFSLALVTAFMTAFYMGRVFFVAFTGESRSEKHGHEAPWVMRGPLVILAVLSVCAGWWVTGFSEFVYFGSPGEEHVSAGFVAMTLMFPLLGLGLAYCVYVLEFPSAASLARRFRLIHSLLLHRYFIDEMYDWIINRIVLNLSRLMAWFDRNAVDGAVNGVAWIVRQSGGQLRRVQTGQVQTYALAIFGGIVVLLFIARIAGAVCDEVDFEGNHIGGPGGARVVFLAPGGFGQSDDSF